MLLVVALLVAVGALARRDRAVAPPLRGPAVRRRPAVVDVVVPLVIVAVGVPRPDDRRRRLLRRHGRQRPVRRATSRTTTSSTTRASHRSRGSTTPCPAGSRRSGRPRSAADPGPGPRRADLVRPPSPRREGLARHGRVATGRVGPAGGPRGGLPGVAVALRHGRTGRGGDRPDLGPVAALRLGGRRARPVVARRARRRRRGRSASRPHRPASSRSRRWWPPHRASGGRCGRTSPRAAPCSRWCRSWPRGPSSGSWPSGTIPCATSRGPSRSSWACRRRRPGTARSRAGASCSPPTTRWPTTPSAARSWSASPRSCASSCS